MKCCVQLFFAISLLLAYVDLLASKNDTIAKTRLKPPRSSLLYQVTPGIHPRKKLWVIGSIEFEDSGFRFVAYTEIPGWPQSEFEKMYPLNRSFKEVFIAYADIKSFRYQTSVIRLKDGRKHKLVGLTQRSGGQPTRISS